MKEKFNNYIGSITKKFSYEETSEMGYRTDFEILLSEVFSQINVKRIDHDAKAKEGNKPDFVIVKDEVPILYIEAKAIGTDLDKIEKSDQMKRYFGYANLVLTDYVEFRFYRNGLTYEEPIRLADIDLKSRTLSPKSENYEHLAKTLLDFSRSHKEPIKNGGHLAKIMGGKAQRIRDNVLVILENRGEEEEIMQVYNSIKELLLHDLELKDFADLYAQTLVYGLFVARYHDTTKETFSRQEARDLIPASNPFLRHFFNHIAGANFEKRLEYIVDELCTAFKHSDVKELMEQYYGTDLWGERHEGPDSVIHFYEDFLQEYDDKLRKKMGAYYTPTPVVRFITRSIDEILNKEFNLPKGLADNSKNNEDVHRVQILDPAVGTGTFISAVIREVYKHIKGAGQEGSWPSYVHHDLLPRLHGFELMMAPYTISHLKLSAAFEKTGFKYFNHRLGIYLTNTLEPAEIQQRLSGFGLSKSISAESHEAAKIKNETPIMVVLGNPPYSGISSNETEYANSLVRKYKVEPGGMQKLQERKHWLNDDYVKFLSFAEEKIADTGEGVLGMITANGYLDNSTFRGMRWHLMTTFDKIYILDLHGSTNKKETAPDGGKDENVFDIKTGVSIILAVKHKESIEEMASVHRADLYGKREEKLQILKGTTWESTEWKKLEPQKPHYYFASFDYEAEREYKKFISVADLFPVNTTGIVTAIDRLSIFYTKGELEETTQSILNSDDPYTKFNIKDGRKYKKEERLKELKEASFNEPTKIAYRPFDIRYMYYTETSERWINSPRSEVMGNFLEEENVGLVFCRQSISEEWGHALVTKAITDDSFVSNKSRERGYVAPLYIYDRNGTKTLNLNQNIVKKIEEIVGKTTSEDILDYVYAVLYLPSYREKYQEFLKIDFPHVPYPKDKDVFWKLVEKGKELRENHLLESSSVENLITTFPETGNNIVEQYKYKNGKVWINDEQYFGDVPEVAWNFYIGGYQPAQQWLKYRKGRKLTNADIEHWQKLVVAISETNRIMKEIDKIQKF